MNIFNCDQLAGLELRVKVEKDMRNNENALKRFGYKLKKYKRPGII